MFSLVDGAAVDDAIVVSVVRAADTLAPGSWNADAGRDKPHRRAVTMKPKDLLIVCLEERLWYRGYWSLLTQGKQNEKR